jgi:hypothetical protein
MVTIIDVAERKNAKEETFIALILSSGVEMVKSKAGKFYASTKKASVPCTLSLQVAKTMIGQKMPGNIIKIPSETYSYTAKNGDTVDIDFTYEYSDEATNMAESVFS